MKAELDSTVVRMALPHIVCGGGGGSLRVPRARNHPSLV